MRKLSLLDMLLLIFLIIFGIFMVYQLAKVVGAGSWATEDILISSIGMIITSLFVVVGFLVNLSRTIGRLEAEFLNLKTSFCNLAKDFKLHLSNHKK